MRKFSGFLFKPTDFFITVVLFLFPLWGFFYSTQRQEKGNFVIINTPDGKYRYLLSKDRTIKLKGLLGDFVVEIKNGEVYVKETSCPQKICQRFKISKANENIICIPNMISIRIDNNKEWEIDGITQ